MKSLKPAVFQRPAAVACAAVFALSGIPTQAQKPLLTHHVTSEIAKGESYDNARM